MAEVQVGKTKEIVTVFFYSEFSLTPQITNSIRCVTLSFNGQYGLFWNYFWDQGGFFYYYYYHNYTSKTYLVTLGLTESISMYQI